VRALAHDRPEHRPFFVRAFALDANGFAFDASGFALGANGFALRAARFPLVPLAAERPAARVSLQPSDFTRDPAGLAFNPAPCDHDVPHGAPGAQRGARNTEDAKKKQDTVLRSAVELGSCRRRLASAAW